MIPETQKPLPDTPSLPDTPPLPPDNDVGADAFGIDVVDTEKAEYTYAEMVEDLSLLKKRYGDKMSYETIGTSLDGRSIYAVTLGNPNAENQIIISAGIHAREYMTPMLVMKQIEFYLSNYDTGSYGGIPFSELFEKYALCILPMCNPDGITLVQNGVEALNSPQLRETVIGIYNTDRKNITDFADILTMECAAHPTGGIIFERFCPEGPCVLQQK
jgi:g-D-glutamyl-meso-diaminopimelate peptidase